MKNCICGTELRGKQNFHSRCSECRDAARVIEEDYRETVAFDNFCVRVLAEITKLDDNAKYSTLSGKHAPFYDDRQRFNEAIEKLAGKCLIEIDDRTSTTYFRAVEPKEAEVRRKQTAREFMDNMSRYFFGESDKTRPLPSAFPERAI